MFAYENDEQIMLHTFSKGLLNKTRILGPIYNLIPLKRLKYGLQKYHLSFGLDVCMINQRQYCMCLTLQCVCLEWGY